MGTCAFLQASLVHTSRPSASRCQQQNVQKIKALGSHALPAVERHAGRRLCSGQRVLWRLFTRHSCVVGPSNSLRLHSGLLSLTRPQRARCGWAVPSCSLLQRRSSPGACWQRETRTCCQPHYAAARALHMRKDARTFASRHAYLRSLTASTCLLASILCLTPPARLHGHGENERQPTLEIS